MMIMSLNDKDIHTKRETGLDITTISTTTTAPNGKYTAKSTTTAATTSSTRQWSGFKNPRIVRVSRTFGGKDRHSKVRTIRGLRDRRIRLSVPTAIQLYDLQDRLGLSQPSKVIDWLLDATKLDIDHLPPLQIPPGSFDQFHHAATMDSNGCAPNNQHQNHNNSSSLTPFLDANLAISMDKASNVHDGCEDEEYEHGGGGGSGLGGQVSAQNFFPINAGNTFLSGLLASNTMPYSYYKWDPNTIALTSQFGGIGSMPSSQDHQDGENGANGNSSATMANIQQGAHQLFFCPSTSLFPTYGNTNQMQAVAASDNNPFQQWSSSSSLSPTMKSFPFSNNHDVQLSHDQSNDTDDQANKDEENG